MAQARRRRYLAGTPRPVAPLEPVPADVEPVPADVEHVDQNVADDVAVPVNDVPAIPREQNADNLDDSNDQPCPTGRGHRRRRLPASLSPGGDLLLFLLLEDLDWIQTRPLLWSLDAAVDRDVILEGVQYVVKQLPLSN